MVVPSSLVYFSLENFSMSTVYYRLGESNEYRVNFEANSHRIGLSR